MEKILDVEKLTVKIGGETIIQNITFDVSGGESLVVIGPNGSGKTILLKTLIGSMPFEGQIAWSPNAIIGYVPQKLDLERNLPLSMADFLASKETSVKSRAEIKIREALELVNLSPSLLKKSIGSLSGGQFQRALIAFALLGKPNILLFDEPTAGVDSPGEEKIYETLHRLQKERGMALIIVSHDLHLVYSYAKKVLCLNREGLCFGEPKEVLTADVLQSLYGESRQIYKHAHE